MKCRGKSEESVECCKRDTGPIATRAFLSLNPAQNVFSVTCKGGCIQVLKAVHDCLDRESTPAELDKVKDLCEGKETCVISNHPVFFGARTCVGTKNSWLSVQCNNGTLSEKHVDGPVRITHHSRDFKGNMPEGNRFRGTCRGGHIRVTKVVHDCDGFHNRIPRHDEMEKVRAICENKEHCNFTPAPSFFGHRGCGGVKWTWVTLDCINGHYSDRHVDGMMQGGD